MDIKIILKIILQDLSLKMAMELNTMLKSVNGTLQSRVMCALFLQPMEVMYHQAVTIHISSR